MKRSILLIVLILFFMAGVVWAEEAVDRKNRSWEAAEWFIKGHKALSAENYDEAIKCYKKTIALDPSFTNAHYFLGNIFLKKGMPDDAIREYKKAIAQRPNAAQTHAQLGSAYWAKGMTDETMYECKKAIAIDSNNPLAHFTLGCVFDKKGNKSVAANHLYKAGLLYIKQGNREGALKAYENLKKTDSKELAQKLYQKLYPELKQKKSEQTK